MLKIELVAREGRFGADIIDSVSQECDVAKNNIFIGAPEEKRDFSAQDFGGAESFSEQRISHKWRVTMNRNALLLILVLLMVGISACEISERVAEPWVPVLEDTGFSYLRDSVSEVMKATEEASQAIQSGQKAESTEALQQAMNALLALHFYYIPMTEVRQLVYDADRLFYLKQSDRTQKKLREANTVLLDIATSDGQNLERPVNDLIVMIDDLILNIQESSSAVPQKFREVGHRVNLMALKGQLILSGVNFDYER